MAAKTQKTKSNIRAEEFTIIKSPCITEKATVLAEQDFYTFKVDERSNKIQIKEFIEKRFNIEVVSVRIISVPKKPKKRGQIKGFKSGFKKAIVRVKKGQKIDLTVS
jgi:large subunit ribosomal protein L23